MLHETLTDRLRLLPLDPCDEAMVQAIYAIESDPATWMHLPEGVVTDVSHTHSLAEAHAKSWRAKGAGWWVAAARIPIGNRAEGAIIGLGGVAATRPSIPAWNLGYRFTPDAWGRGLAGELARAAIAAAEIAQPDMPVTARALSKNQASWRVLERAGLSLVWEGPAPTNAPLTAGMMLRVYSDRPLGVDVLESIVALG